LQVQQPSQPANTLPVHPHGQGEPKFTSGPHAYVKNAVIESAELGIERGFVLSAWVMVEFGDGSSQGFGGFVLGGIGDPKDVPSARHGEQPNVAAEFICGVLRAAGVDSWGDLPEKSIRVGLNEAFGTIIGIGHIIKDDRWFHPSKAFAALRRSASLRHTPDEWDKVLAACAKANAKAASPVADGGAA